VPESGGVDRDGMANPVMEVPTREQQERLEQFQSEIQTLQTQLAEAPAEPQSAKDE
jgi:hypothetical protein